MKKTIIVICLILLSVGAKAQFSITYSAGYGDYDMKDMKAVAESALQQVINSGARPEGTRITDNYPASLIHNLDINYQIKTHEFGLKTSFMSTGAKMAYADYSGTYKERLISNSYRLGLVYRNHFWGTSVGNHSLSLFGELSPAVTINTFRNKAEVKLYQLDIKQKENTTYANTTAGFSIQPMVGARFKLYEHFLISLSGGYDLSFGANMEVSYSGGAYGGGKKQTYSSGDRANWSGLRLNAGIGYMF